MTRRQPTSPEAGPPRHARRLGPAALVFGLLGAASCKEPQMTLFHTLAARCGDASPCRLHLSEVTPFAWDHVGFLPMYGDHAAAFHALGVSPERVPEFEDWVVFVEGGRVVHTERRAYDPERPFRDTWFLAGDAPSREWRVYERGADLFEVEARRGASGTNLLLTPLQAPSSAAGQGTPGTPGG